MEKRVLDTLGRIKQELVSLLAPNLVGIYLHGSLAYGCFSWEQSDLDFLVVVKEALQQAEKERVIQSLIEIEEVGPRKGLEMSVVCMEDLKPPCFPMPFHLHYSHQHRLAAQENVSLYCANMQGVDLDLTAHIMVICQKGIVLYGEELEKIFQAPSRKEYLESVWYDLENSVSMVSDDPVSTILNLCRTLAYVKEERFLSKKEGGEWVLEHCLSYEKAMLEVTLKAYQTGSSLVLTPSMLQFVKNHLDELSGYLG